MINWLPGATCFCAGFALVNGYTWQGVALIALTALYIRAWRKG